MLRDRAAKQFASTALRPYIARGDVNASRRLANACTNVEQQLYPTAPNVDIEHSFDELSSSVDPPFADRFYAHFLEQFPRYRKLFSETDWRSQQAMLTIGLQTVVRWYRHRTPAGEEYLRLLGDRHRRMGIELVHFQDFQEALLQTLAQFHGESWTQTLAEQWSAALQGTRQVMFQGDSKQVMFQGDSKSDLHYGTLAQVSEVLAHEHERINRSRHLLRLTDNVDRGLLLDDVLNYVYDEFKDVIPYNRIGFALIDEVSGMVVSHWARSDRPVFLDREYQAKLATSTLDRIVKTGRPRILNDLLRYLQRKPDSASTQLIVREGMRSSLTCPLISDGHAKGFLFFSSVEVDTYKNAHVEFFQNIAARLSQIVEKARLYSHLQNQAETIEKHNRKVSEELEFARRFQRSLISHGSIDVAGLSIESFYDPVSHVGGDLLEIVTLDDQRTFICIADAVGHGVKAAMVMAATKMTLVQARRTIEDPAAILGQVNDQLHQLLREEGSFVTALCAIVDASQEALLVASAGHPFPWQFHAATGEVSELDHGGGGLPLGIDPLEKYTTRKFPLGNEDTVLMCTDGVLEASSPGGELYGVERLTGLLREHGGKSAKGLIQAVKWDLGQHGNGVAADDDIALVAVKWTGSG